jgi:hypothetical protein
VTSSVGAERRAEGTDRAVEDAPPSGGYANGHRGTATPWV